MINNFIEILSVPGVLDLIDKGVLYLQTISGPASTKSNWLTLEIVLLLRNSKVSSSGIKVLLDTKYFQDHGDDFDELKVSAALYKRVNFD